MRVRRSDCERVTERDELVGRLSFASRLPQYLLKRNCQLGDLSKRRRPRMNCLSVSLGKKETYFTTAMLTGAVVLARYTLPSAIFDKFSVSMPSRVPIVRPSLRNSRLESCCSDVVSKERGR